MVGCGGCGVLIGRCNCCVCVCVRADEQNVRGVFAEFDADKDGYATATHQPPPARLTCTTQPLALTLPLCTSADTHRLAPVYCRYISLAELKEMLRTNGIDYYTDAQIQQMVSRHTHTTQTERSITLHFVLSAHCSVVLFHCGCRRWQWTVRRLMQKASVSSPSHDC